MGFSPLLFFRFIGIFSERIWCGGWFHRYHPIQKKTLCHRGIPNLSLNNRLWNVGVRCEIALKSVADGTKQIKKTRQRVWNASGSNDVRIKIKVIALKYPRMIASHEWTIVSRGEWEQQYIMMYNKSTVK